MMITNRETDAHPPLAAVERFADTINTRDTAACAVCWSCRFTAPDGSPIHLRGTDRFTVRDGKITGKYSYVKR